MVMVIIMQRLIPHFTAAVCGMLLLMSGNVFAQYYYPQPYPEQQFIPCSNYPTYNCAPIVTTPPPVFPVPLYFNGVDNDHFDGNHGHGEFHGNEGYHGGNGYHGGYHGGGHH